MKIYKTVTRNKETLAVRYECGSCHTTFSLADLEYTRQSSSLGQWTVKPDIDHADCPFCHATLDFSEVEEVVTEAVPREAEKYPANIPATETQNCLSHGCTINPQINHRLVDLWVAHNNGFPCPVPTKQDLGMMSELYIATD